jgi:hypothetical protein
VQVGTATTSLKLLGYSTANISDWILLSDALINYAGIGLPANGQGLVYNQVQNAMVWSTDTNIISVQNL